MSRHVAAFARMFERGGRRVTIARPTPNAPAQTIENVRVRIRGFQAEEIAGGMSSSERRVIVLAEDVPAEFGLQVNDDVLVDGGRLKITGVDRHTYRDGEVLLAYDCTASGS